MSGGRYDYFYVWTEDLGQFIDRRRHLKALAERLAGLPYAHDAATETRRLLTAVEHLEARVQASEGLAEVWRAVEWWDSGDSGEDAVREALAEYRRDRQESTPAAPGPAEDAAQRARSLAEQIHRDLAQVDDSANPEYVWYGYVSLDDVRALVAAVLEPGGEALAVPGPAEDDEAGRLGADAYDLDLQAEALREAAAAWEGLGEPGGPSPVGVWLRARAASIEGQAEDLRDQIPPPDPGGCQVIEVDGQPVRVQAAPDLPDEAREALVELVRAAQTRHADKAEEADRDR